MNLNQLKIFYFAAKYGNLSAAAEHLYITQPAVTKGIQRLQEHYEIKFVNHIGKKLVLTDAGEVLYGIAEKIFEMESQAEESIRDFQQRKRGHIRILSSESFGDYYLPRII
ncbi:MAG: LysR family transcriptional regulator, partial [Desulfobacterales bacterium]